jgi:hypothetical protein
MIQLITALFNTLSVFASPPPQNDTEKQLFDLVNSYRADMGFGFRRTTAEVLTGLSSCFTLLSLLGALTILFLLREKANYRIMKGILNIQCILFGICFLMMGVFTYLEPIILTGLAFASLLIARVMMEQRGAR